jgi:hypothetical protein
LQIEDCRLKIERQKPSFSICNLQSTICNPNTSYAIRFTFFLTLALLWTNCVLAQVVTVSIPTDLTAKPQASGVKIPVNVTDATALGVVSADLTVDYDTTMLTAKGATLSETIAAEGLVTSNIDESRGRIRVGVISATPFRGGGALAYLLFDVDSTRPDASSAISLVEVKLNAGAIPVDASDGQCRQHIRRQ